MNTRCIDISVLVAVISPAPTPTSAGVAQRHEGVVQ